eukprot:TRINITY_DN16750_c0_g1_i3.p2 TRINITY_DN16750_c0_g1~~TRINITY_DN16750_c0_g1_i3.p2  ORF type:complete len:500 (-),score=122.93 TRINITY_DN16750_c0_g1_i3:124-1623(-)
MTQHGGANGAAIADFVETRMRYYAFAARATGHCVKSAGTGAKSGGAAVPVNGHNVLNGFESAMRGISGFLDRALALLAAQRDAEQTAVEAILRARAATLRGHAEAAFATMRRAAEQLEPRLKLEPPEPLPAEALGALNEAVLGIEGRYGVSAKADAIPAQLLSAQPGTRLYPNLVKKVDALCARDLAEVERREVEACRTQLLAGGADAALDSRRTELTAERDAAMRTLIADSVGVLSLSDHLPIEREIAIGPRSASPLRLLTWNVMEFPLPGAKDPVLDGVSPYCDMMLKFLDRKGTDERTSLLQALTSDAVIEEHYRAVERRVQEALEAGGVDAVLLQEINGALQARLTERCSEKGWSACFSSANGDPSKCDAITAILAKEPFDEQTQVEIQENKKVRNFAAVRRGSVWIVSCHVPMASGKKGQESGEEVAARVAGQLYTFARSRAAASGDDSASELVIGGDWNANLREVEARVAGAPPQGMTRAQRLQERCPTCARL